MALKELENDGKEAYQYVRKNTLGPEKQAINDLDFQEKLLNVCKPKYITFCKNSRYMVIYRAKKMMMLDIKRKRILSAYELPCKQGSE